MSVTMGNKILIIEDDYYLSKNLKLLLEQEGYDTVTASSYVLAKAAFDREQPDLCLVDILLPDGNGFELCEYLRKRSSLPVLIISAKDEEDSIVKGLELGADDYVTKPFKPKELLSRIRANLRRVSMPGNRTLLSCEGIELNTEKYTVTKNGEPMELRKMEYRLLKSFMEHPEMVLTREALLEQLWDKDGNFVEDNTLSVTMKRLREKLGETAAGESYIATIRGVGYRWSFPVVCK